MFFVVSYMQGGRLSAFLQRVDGVDKISLICLNGVMELVDVTANKTHVKQLSKWLKRDFPLAERTPFRILESLAKKGGIRFYFAKEGGSVLAYTVLHFFRGYTQVLYLAVMPEGRGRGTGSKLIPLIKEKAGGTLILQLEDPACAERQE